MAEPKEIVIERVFDAPVEKVWEAWTDPKKVKEWWGPKDFTAPSIKIDLRVGGKYIFAMHGPEGSEWDKDMYSAGIYKEIIPYKKLVVTDYFSDEDGNPVSPTQHGLESDTPQEMTATFEFEDMGDDKTKLTITYPKPETREQYEALLRSGMTDGWNQSLDKLEGILR
jgi:uncharacterized protein YndB with AHSA1/START domain